MRFWKHCLLFLLAILISGVGASEIWPGRSAKLMLGGLNWSAGLQSKSIQTSFGKLHYLEGGNGPTLVFLHGIFALKEHWIDVSRQVSGTYRVILLDLPGFGENQRLNPTEYDYAQQAQNVLETLDKIGIDHFHIAANSMGAQIAGQLATSIPDRVLSVSFIGGPAGITSPVPSDMENAIANGNLPLLATSQSEYDTRMEWLFPKQPFIPRPIARYWASNEISYADTNRKIWDAVATSMSPRLEVLAPNIKQPSLVIWCNKDRIFHVSGAQTLANALPNETLKITDDCGHLPMLDQPNMTGNLLLKFLNAQGGQ